MAIIRPRSFNVTRGTFIIGFIRDLEVPYRKFLTTELDQIVSRNEAIHGAPCYFVGDTVYGRNLVIALIGRTKLGGIANLDPSLTGQHQEFISHYAEHQNSWTRFSQTLRVLMMQADSWQTLRNMFPDYVLEPYLRTPEFPDLQGLTRTAPDLHTASLQNLDTWRPSQISEYLGIKETLDLYVGYRLL